MIKFVKIELLFILIIFLFVIPIKAKDMTIHQAVATGQIDVVRQRIKSGIDVDLRDDEGFTPLILASLKGKKEIVNLLLESGADINAVSDNKYSALIAASFKGYEEIARILIENGADINLGIKNGFWPAIMYACFNGNIKIVEILLNNNACIYYRDKKDNTAFTLALEQKWYNIIELLKQNDIKNKNNYNKALRMIKNKEYENALDVYDSLSIAMYINPLVHLYKGHINFALENYDKAIIDYQTVLQLSSEKQFKTDSLISIGKIMSIKSRYKEANDYYNIAIKLNPNNSQVYIMRGMNYKKMKRYNEAIYDLTRAINLTKGKDSKLLILRSEIYVAQGRYNEALLDLNNYIETKPNTSNYLIYNNRAHINMKLKNYKNAINNIKKAISLNIQDGNLYLTYAEISACTGDIESFKQNIKVAKEILNLKDNDLKDMYSNDIKFIEMLSN